MTARSPRLAALYSDPARERALGWRFLIGAVVLGVLFLICLLSFFAFGFGLGRLITTIVLFLLTSGFGLLTVNNMKLSRLRGEDLLTLAVEEDGIVAQTQFLVRWEEITEVTQQTLGRAGRGGVKYAPRSINVKVRDHAAVVARAVGDQQYLFDKQEDGSSVMDTGLGATPDDEFFAFMRVLQTELSRRQIPLHADEGGGLPGLPPHSHPDEHDRPAGG